MKSSYLLHHLIFFSAQNTPEAVALTCNGQSMNYLNLSKSCLGFAKFLSERNMGRQARVAVYLEKRFEFVIACFGAAAACNIFVPINPILKKDQVKHILLDSGAKILVTSRDRFDVFEVSDLGSLDLDAVVLVDNEVTTEEVRSFDQLQNAQQHEIQILNWKSIQNSEDKLPFPIGNPESSTSHIIDTEAVSILYTSGSTGRPKGVVLSHRNMVFGAKSVASYLENVSSDILLGVLPLSFDAGFSQLTTAFFVGAKVCLLDYMTPKDILNHVISEKITGLTAVPPLWNQIGALNWPATVTKHLRYFANTGGRMPLELLNKLRGHFPLTKPYLMYGLTESFRSTYLPPDQVDRIPDSIGKAIPNAEVLVLRADGNPCSPGEPGELIHRGALVGLGYWNDPVKTNEKYRNLPLSSQVRPKEIILPEVCVFSGDIVKKDSDGYIYFIGRNDEMIKSSGYRISPMEIEEVVGSSGLAFEVLAFGVPHESLGQSVVVSVVLDETEMNNQSEAKEKILNHCRKIMPMYMVPACLLIRNSPHPRNQNGKLDRPRVRQEFLESLPKEDSNS